MADSGDGEDAAQKIIDGFVRTMVAGRDLPTISTAGEGLSKVQLDGDVTTLFVQSRGKRREIAIESIETISLGEEVPDDVTWDVDDLCVTLLVEESDGVSFRLADMEDRDTFALVLGMFVDNRRAAVDDGDYDAEDDTTSTLSAAALHTVSEKKQGDQDGSAAKLSEAQKIVKSFVQRIVKGRTLQMLSTSGGTVECLVHLDRDLTEMTIQRSNKKDAKKRVIPLQNIEHISVGEDTDGDAELKLDEMSVALMLEEGMMVAFRFEDVEERDAFGMCLGIFVDGNRRKAKRR